MNRFERLPPIIHRKSPVSEFPGRYPKLTCTLLLASVFLCTDVTDAQEGPQPEFSISRYTLDGGGGSSTGGTFSLTGTIGQFDASVQAATGGPYSLSGGFWGAGRADHLFSGGFESLPP